MKDSARRVPQNKHDELVVWLTHVIREQYPEPECGYGTVAHVLVKAGIENSKSSVARNLKKKPNNPRPSSGDQAINEPSAGVPFHILAPIAINRTWHLDFTTIWIAGFPCYVTAIIGGYSRKLLAIKAYALHPDTDALVELLRQTVESYGVPRFLVTDHGPVFRDRFKAAVEAHGTTLVKGKVYSCQFNGKVERFFRTLKLWQRIALFARSVDRIQGHLDSFQRWYNSIRCHQGIGGLTPDERWSGRKRSAPKPILARVPLKPAITFKRGLYDGDACLPVVEIRVDWPERRAA